MTMSVVYNGEHSITFYKGSGSKTVKKNTWTDFHIIPTKRPYIEIPSAEIQFVPIPGTNKRYDLTDYKPGGQSFGPRTGTWEFAIAHDYWGNWAEAYEAICDYFHASEVTLILADDPEIVYSGVITVSGYSAGSSYSTITLQYDLDYSISRHFPIKFLFSDGTEYAADLGVEAGADYISTYDDETKELYLYDLQTLDYE